LFFPFVTARGSGNFCLTNWFSPSKRADSAAIMAGIKSVNSGERDAVSTLSAPEGKATMDMPSSTITTALKQVSTTGPTSPEEDPTPSSPTRSPRSKLRITLILTALFLSLFVAALDATIVSTAIPTIVADLDSPSGYSWIGGAYLIANAAGAPIWAKLSDIFGRKPILLAGVALFVASSIVCALAIDMKMMIVGRALQGTAGGGLIMLVNVCISDIFSMRERSLYLGLCEGIWAAAGAVGPILGGVLTDLANWRWCWWINLPVCGVAGLLLLLFLDVHNPRTPLVAGIKAIDWAGSLSILALVLMLLLGLDFGGDTFPWDSPKVICLIVIGALCSLLFIYAEKRIAKYPLMPMALFREGSNVASLLVVAFHGVSFIAGEYYMPLYFQSAKAASALRSGVLLVPLIVLTASFGVLTGIFIHRTGRYREPIWIGTVLLTTGYGAFISLVPSTSIARIVGFQLLAGAGSGMLFEPSLVALQAFSHQDDVATATSTFSFIRSLSLAVSIILGGVVFQNSMDAREPGLRAAGLPESLAEALTGKNAAANVMLTHQLEDPFQQELVKDAFAWSLRNMWIMYTGFSALAVVSGVFVKQKKLSKEHTETVTGLKEKVLARVESVRSRHDGQPRLHGDDLEMTARGGQGEISPA
jgi:EmrB/QacA subfamily drug resistance transporter